MKLIMQFMKPYRKLFIVAVLLIILDIGGALYIPTLVANMLNTGSAAEANINTIYITGAKIIIASIVSGLGAILGGYVCAVLTSKIGRDIRNAIYEKSLKLSVFDFKQFGSASITTRTISDISNIQTALTMFIQMVLPVPIIFVIAITLTFRLDTLVGFILLGILAFVLILAVIIMKIAAPIFEKLQKILDKMSTVLLENLTGVRVIRAFNKEKDEQKRLENAFSDYAVTSIKANRIFANLDGFSYLVINLFIIIIYWISGGQISSGNIQVGDITALIEYAIMALFYLMMAQMVILTLPRALECCSRIQEILEHSPEIKDLVTTNPKDIKKDDILTFNNVRFRFADAEEDTLHDLSFSCKRGETTAIIGSTGSGKSTIAALILRYHDVTQGSILFNGTNIKQMTQKHLRERISYVQQKAWLFSGTIAENLRYGNANASEKELKHSLDVAQASEFVQSFSDGIEHRVAQGGTNFSGGQRQRLSIARAITKKSELYIFDDSFSALDFKTDAALRKALKKETENVAVLIIAQRVSTIRNANQIIVLNEGRIVGKGTHDELIKNCDVYKEIVNSQTKEDDE